VPFGGKYRIIDFVLSNFINSDLLGVCSEQFRSQFSTPTFERRLAVWRTPQEPLHHSRARSDALGGRDVYQGTADAIFQNINLVEQANPHVVAIFGGDHIYRMNIASMIEFHMHSTPKSRSRRFPLPANTPSNSA